MLSKTEKLYKKKPTKTTQKHQGLFGLCVASVDPDGFLSSVDISAQDYELYILSWLYCSGKIPTFS